MGQIWAALKSLGIIAELLKALLTWIKELRRESAQAKADEAHAKNAAAIAHAFHAPPLPGLQDPPKGGHGPGAAHPPPVPNSEKPIP